MMHWTWFEAPPSGAYMFRWVIVPRQLHFHIYYLFVESNWIIAIYTNIISRVYYDSDVIQIEGHRKLTL
jgi:hypothetical protein